MSKSEMETRLDERAGQIKQLQAKLAKVLNALRNLHDVQNGPPLLRHQKQWQAAYDEAGDVLEEMEHIGGDLASDYKRLPEVAKARKSSKENDQ